MLRLGDDVRANVKRNGHLVFSGEAVVKGFVDTPEGQKVQVWNPRFGYITCEFAEVSRA